MKKVRWTKTAQKTLEETSDFILERWNPQVNEEFLDQLDYRIIQIQRNPELAPVFESSNIRRLLIHKTISLFYINNSR